MTRGRPMPLWLLRARTWNKRRKSPSPGEADRITLTPEEHLILAILANHLEERAR